MQNLTLTLLLAGILPFVSCEKKEVIVVSESNPQTVQNPDNYPVATFAGGCFWGVEYNFRRVPGVVDAQVGFMGGNVDNPSYRQVCYDDTRHAEVVHLWYDPAKISYEKLVKIFFILHDPTTLNRQGPDVGDQYRSAIFYHTPEQKEIAEKVKAQFNTSGRFKRPIVTEITEAKEFWRAEDYHQRYIEKNPSRSCHVVEWDDIQRIVEGD